MPMILWAQASESWIEDVISSADGESPVLDSLEWRPGPFLIPVLNLAGSRERVRFQSSLMWTMPVSNSLSWSDTWARSRVTTLSGKQLRTDVLAIRRVHDPRTLDELHLTIAGKHEPSEIEFTLGTYQIDWGHGILASSAFGSARSFSFFRNSAIAPSKGVVPRATSREANWLRGAAIEKQLGRVHGAVFGNYREWNGNTGDESASLTGLLNPSTRTGLLMRDNIEERSAGVSARLESDRISIGLLAQSSSFSPDLANVGPAHHSESVFASGHWAGTVVSAEAARSGAHTAWSAILSQGTEQWRGAFYAMYAAPNYYALRSQGSFSFGEPFRNARIIGTRLGTERGAHDFSLDIRSNRTPAATATVTPVRQSDEATVGWTFKAAANASVDTRASYIVRNENRDGQTIDRRIQSLRVEPVWTRLLVWSLRSEYRRHSLSSENSAMSGNYLHLQAIRNEGMIRPGLRVAVFSLDGLESQILIYEPTILGAYPLETFSGNGNRVSAWLTAYFGNWTVRTKFAHTRRENSDDVAEYALAFSYRR